jgi:hypothetical protein
MRRTLIVLALLPLTLVAAPAGAAVTIVSQRGAGQVSTFYIDGPRMRIDSPPRIERATVMIVDATAKHVVMLDEKAKTYTELTEDDLKRMRAKMDAMRAMMQERMKNMPPEQRKQMEQMMGQSVWGAGVNHKSSDWTYKAMGQKKTINGFACEMYQALEDGKPQEEVCVSPWSAGVLKKDDIAAIAKFGQQMMEDLGQGAGENAIFGRIDKAPGIPISRVPLEGGTRGEEEQVKSVKRGAVPASLFAIPAGYTKKDLPEMMGGAGPGGHHRGPPRP